MPDDYNWSVLGLKAYHTMFSTFVFFFSFQRSVMSHHDASQLVFDFSITEASRQARLKLNLQMK